MVVNKDNVTIYYAAVPRSTGYLEYLHYQTPHLLSNEYAKKIIKGRGPFSSMFSCPASAAKLKRTLVYNSPVSMSFKYDVDIENDKKEIYDQSGDKMGIDYVRDPMFDFGPTLCLTLGYIFFADEPVEASFTAPYFHKAKYMNYGSVIPGNFDIGQWFRPYNFEVQMWNNSGDFYLEKDEPLFYVEFLTDKKITFKEFEVTPLLYSYMNSCINSTEIYGLGQTLKSRYSQFKNVRLKDKILTEINKNLIKD
jgi:hypothetical protein